MAERSTIAQTVQVGSEATAGTSVAASKRLPSLQFGSGVQAGVNTYRGAGFKYPAVSAEGKEWMQASIEGPATYDELAYLLSSVGQKITPVQIGATPGYNWTFLPSPTTEDTVATFTVEQGSAVRAHKWTYGLVTDLTVNFNRDAVNVSGTMIGRALQDAITMTAAPTGVPLVPVLGKNVSVYLDTTSGGLGGTKLTRVLDGSFSIGSRFAPLWVVDGAQSSFVTHIETEPAGSFSLLVEADAAGMGNLALLQSGATRFIRVEAIGANIGAGADYTMRFDAAVKVTGIENFEDADGVYAVRYTFTIVADATWGSAWQAKLVNTTTSL